MSIYRLTLATLQTRVRAAGGNLGDATIRQALPALKVLAVAGAKEHFQRQESPGGVPWKPLARPRIDGSSRILQDKGLLQNSIKASSDAEGKTLTLTASHPGATVHQYGATIKPRHGKFLALPLTKEAKRVGSPRKNRFPRPLFVVEVGSHELFLCESKDSKRKSTLVFHYVLRKVVTIPARPFLGFSARTLDKMDRVMADTAADNAVALFEPKSANWNKIF